LKSFNNSVNDGNEKHQEDTHYVILAEEGNREAATLSQFPMEEVSSVPKGLLLASCRHLTNTHATHAAQTVGLALSNIEDNNTNNLLGDNDILPQTTPSSQDAVLPTSVVATSIVEEMTADEDSRSDFAVVADPGGQSLLKAHSNSLGISS
jgi:hypothetical protein